MKIRLFLRKGEKVLKRSARRVSRRVRGSKNRGKARQIHSIAPSQNKQAAALHHAVKLAGVRNLIQRCSRPCRFENKKYGEESLLS